MTSYRTKQQNHKISAILLNNPCPKGIDRNAFGRLCLENHANEVAEQECKQTYEDLHGPIKQISQDYDLGSWSN